MTRALGKRELQYLARHERDLALAAQPGGHPRGIWFDAAAGERVVQFVEEYCTHHEGEWRGKPVRLEEWQKAVLRCLYGWKRANGTRRFRTAYIELGRKNGKSFWASALALYMLVADGEGGAQVYSSATKEEQATIVWRGAAAMVAQSKGLQRFVKQMRSKGGRLVVEKSGSFFKPLGADSKTLDGMNPHCNVVDELHAHRDRRVWDVLSTAMGARRQPMTIAITTAGTYDEESIGWQQHDYACKVLDGTFEDDSFFAFIAAIDDEDDPFDPAVWGKANPNLGISCKLDELAEQAETAKRQPSFCNEFLRLRLNRWTQQTKRWLNPEQWRATDPIEQTAEQYEAHAQTLAGEECYGGLDLAQRRDTTALVLAFPRPGGVVELLCRFWLPEETVAEALKKGRAYYEEWHREGWLRLTPGNVTDFGFIRAEINELARTYQIREIGFDSYSAQQISTELIGDGLAMVQVQQSFAQLSEPSKDLEARIAAGRVRHGGHPILRWMVGNANTKADVNGNIRPVKPNADSPLKVDGVQAAVMALGRMILSDGSAGCPYTEKEGLL